MIARLLAGLGVALAIQFAAPAIFRTANAVESAAHAVGRPGRPPSPPPLVGKCKKNASLARECDRLWRNCVRADEGHSICAGWFRRCCYKQSILGPVISTP